MVFNATGGIDWTDDPTPEMACAGGVHKDKLIMVTPIEGVLNRDVRHTQLYNRGMAGTRKMSPYGISAAI